MEEYHAIQKYFWDVNPTKLDIKKDYIFIIGRILEYGDITAAQWLLKIYPLPLIKQVLATKRNFSRKSAQFWQQHFGLLKSNIPCLQKSSQKMPVPLWSH